MKNEVKQLPKWVIVLACVLPFLGFWTYGLFDLDEGFYAAVVADMMRRGDWITPTLHGIPWFEKPILAYWLAMPSIQLLGQDWGPRMPSVICTLLSTWHIFRWSQRVFGLNVARLTALLYATNLLVVGIGRMMMTDAPLVLCLIIAITSLYDVYLAEGKSRWRGWLTIGAAVGFGILAKGPVALILFGGVMIAMSVVSPRFRAVWKSAWPLGLFVSMVVLATWYVPCYVANGQNFIQKFLIEQNIGRFAGGDKAHAVPFWAHPIYFPAVILLSAIPFVFFGTKLFKNACDQKTEHQFLLVWFCVPTLFFTISGTKLPHYILPAMAPFSLLIARALLSSKREVPWEKLVATWSVVVLLLAQFIMKSDWERRMQEVQSLAKYGSSLPGVFYAYKLVGSGDTSISLQLRPTSHPSIGFYASKPYVETDSLISADPGIVLTRKEVFEHDSELQSLKISPVKTLNISQKVYVLLRLER